MNHLKQLVLTVLLTGMLSSLITGCGATAPPSNVTAAAPQATASPATAVSDIDQARTALNAYFTALHTQHYELLGQLYGGSYVELFGYNPKVPADDRMKLWENACTVNGFKCLEIKEIVHAEAVSPTEFRFVVEFKNEDGSLFTHTPPGSAQPVSQWPYTVKKVDDAFQVQELPVYAP